MGISAFASRLPFTILPIASIGAVLSSCPSLATPVTLQACKSGFFRLREELELAYFQAIPPTPPRPLPSFLAPSASPQRPSAIRPAPAAPRSAGPSAAEGKKILQRISRETGAAYFEPSNKQPVGKIYSLIEEELRNQYSLGYTPDKTGSGEYRKITVAVKKKGLAVQAREGYYAR